MANPTLEREGYLLAISSNGDGTYSLKTHDISGGAGVAYQGLEIQGYRIQLFNNGDGTYSPCVTSTTGASDKTIEFQGFTLKIHPTGQTDPVTGQPLYAVVTVAV
jgi:hypothetical protein